VTEPDLSLLPDHHWQRRYHEALLGALKEIGDRLASEASHTEEGRREGVRYALQLFNAACGSCGVCWVAAPAHSEPYPCGLWDLLDLLFEDGAFQLGPGTVIGARHLTILRKIWDLKPGEEK
jgi:hypothetical protein